MVAGFSIAQTPNSIPTSGNVGIGTTSPTVKLQVNGAVKIDSSLTVKKSMTVQKNTVLNGSLHVNDKLLLPTLTDTALSGSGLLMIDSNGRVINGGNLKKRMYAAPFPTYPEPDCLKDMNGGWYYDAPVWQNESEKMYLLKTQCMRMLKVGIGINPNANLHILNFNDTVTPLLIEHRDAGINKKLLQLDSDGVLHTREILIDQKTWADYVFKDDYELPKLQKVNEYIAKHGHLPGVPSAYEINKNGLNVGKQAKIALQKIEELTLYAIRQNQQLKKQKQIINKLQSELHTLKKQMQVIVNNLKTSVK